MNVASKILLYGCLALAVCSASVTSAQVTELPRGSAVAADGVANEAEWQDARIFLINASSALRVKVLAKHDGTNLLAAFITDLNLYQTRFVPEIVIDAALDRATTWRPDDWWFHVSQRDCDNNGYGEDYSNCQVVQPDWTGAPNFPLGNPNPPPIERFEISIPLSKIGVAPGDTCGMGFVIEFGPGRVLWPQGANMLPSTWGAVAVGANSGTLSEQTSLGAIKVLYR